MLPQISRCPTFSVLWQAEVLCQFNEPQIGDDCIIVIPLCSTNSPRMIPYRKGQVTSFSQVFFLCFVFLSLSYHYLCLFSYCSHDFPVISHHHHHHHHHHIMIIMIIMISTLKFATPYEQYVDWGNNNHPSEVPSSSSSS